MGMPLEWHGAFGKPIEAYHKDKLLVSSVAKYYRPLEVDCLISDPKLAENELGWKTTISLNDMIDEMIKKEKNDLSTS